MSGGYVRPQAHGDHQVVIFTFAGELTKTHVDGWNTAVRGLKAHFGARITGVTLQGHPSPPTPRVARARRKPRKGK